MGIHDLLPNVEGNYYDHNHVYIFRNFTNTLNCKYLIQK